MPNSIIYSTFVRDEQPNKGFKHNHQIIDQILKWTWIIFSSTNKQYSRMFLI